ncbi:MAG: hypothetical protein ABSA44_04540 [Bacteroidota bacterium]
MARIEKRIASKPKTFVAALPFKKSNYQILGGGLLCIVLGYIALAQEPWNGTMPLVVAPILLVLGYCVLIPIGILFRRRTGTEETTQPLEQRSGNSH